MTKLLQSIVQSWIWAYKRLISPLLGPRCRYHPTCSVYASQALKRHGLLKGGLLSAKRICSCHPFSPPPWTDPVPEAFAWGDLIRYKRAQRIKLKTSKKHDNAIEEL